MSLAYNELYTMFGQNCFGCNETLDLHHIEVDGQPYLTTLSQLTGPGDFYYEVEPNTGLMTHMKKDSTVVFSFNCYKEDASKCEQAALPFPAFDSLHGRSFPVFDLTEEMLISAAQLDTSMARIKENHRKMLICGVVLTALAFAAFLLASLFIFINFMNNPVKIEREEDLA